MSRLIVSYASLTVALSVIVFSGCESANQGSEKVARQDEQGSVNEQQAVENGQKAKPPVGMQKTDSSTNDRQKGESDDSTYWESITRMYENAKESGSTSAQNAKEWITEMYGSAKQQGGELGNSTSQWIESMFQSAKDSGTTSAENAKEWYDGELQKLGTWEYRTVEISGMDSATITAELNKLGAERWECFHSAGSFFYCKRPVKSQFENIPAKELIRILPFLL